MLIPCIDCGELATGTRCNECRKEHNRNVAKRYAPRGSRSRGYDSAWSKLSARARKLQPFCSSCGSKEDLQCDHTPAAWHRKERGLSVRLQDVDVLCGDCNRAAGEARPGSPRYLEWFNENVSRETSAH